MHKNYLWQAFIAVVFATTLWYTAVAIYSYYSYSHLKAQTTPSAMDWDIEEKSDEDYVVKAIYRFEFQNKSYPGNTSFTDTPYRNHWAAEQAAKEISKKDWKIWFDPQNPHHSSLQKEFPFKECISAAFLWGLVLYFLWLGFYVAKFKN
jgi:hypothetical protein